MIPQVVMRYLVVWTLLAILVGVMIAPVVRANRHYEALEAFWRVNFSHRQEFLQLETLWALACTYGPSPDVVITAIMSPLALTVVSRNARAPIQAP